MGYFSEEIGISPVPGEFVCAECFGDPSLKGFVRLNAASRHCTFCGNRHARKIAAPIHLVADRILDGLTFLYGDAANGLGFDDREYVGDTYTTFDLVEDHAELQESFGKLHSQLVHMLPDWVWSEVDPYGPRKSDVFRWSWRGFAKTVKRSRRFFFEGPVDRRNDETISPVSLLTAVARASEEYGLVESFPAGQKLFRCRDRASEAERFVRPSEMGPPPEDKSSQSRMSPAGIPMFYGAEEVGTAIAETVDPGKYYATGTFHTLKPLTVLDLTTVPQVSIFDDEQIRDLFHWASFMSSFIADFRKPVDRNGDDKHFEYVPTQIVTEFFRSPPPDEELPSVDAIRYRSARTDGICWVIFATKADVSQTIAGRRDPAHAGKLLALSHIEHSPQRLKSKPAVLWKPVGHHRSGR
jgi:hypothetical protein